MTNPLSRRDILRLGAVGGVGAAIGSAAVAQPAQASPAPAAVAAQTGPTRSPIHAYYLGHGGGAGVLGGPTGPEETVAGGLRQHFRGTVYGAAYAISVPVAHKVGTSCGQPDHTGTVVESTVVWTPSTGTHAVHGGIRDRWLALGAEGGPLGYPVSAELSTEDGRGRLSRFQHGEIHWYPDTGATVHPAR